MITSKGKNGTVSFSATVTKLDESRSTHLQRREEKKCFWWFFHFPRILSTSSHSS